MKVYFDETGLISVSAITATTTTVTTAIIATATATVSTAVATTAATAAIVTTAAAAIVTTATAAARALFARACFVDFQRTATEVGAVECFNSGVSSSVIIHCHKSKTA